MILVLRNSVLLNDPRRQRHETVRGVGPGVCGLCGRSFWHVEEHQKVCPAALVEVGLASKRSGPEIYE